MREAQAKRSIRVALVMFVLGLPAASCVPIHVTCSAGERFTVAVGNHGAPPARIAVREP